MFYRNLEQHLESWLQDPHHKPLIVRGARQVGKTTLVQKISRRFDYFVSLNLEKSEDKRFFELTDNVKTLFETLLISKQLNPEPGKSVLLFLDEIQQFPKAIGLLRYFYEDLPGVYVVAAGSLLEFALGDVPSMPVGRVEQVVLHPMSFDEFLLANGQQMLYDKWTQLAFEPHLHPLFIKAFRMYLVTGGMPEAVKHVVESGGSFLGLPRIFDNIWLSYKEDIRKYQRTQNNQRVLHFLLEHLPFQLDRFSFAGFGQTLYKTREISEAFGQLEKTKILQLVYPSTSLRPPLVPNYKKRPRIQFLDTGLLVYLNKQQASLLLEKNLQESFKGGIINHIVWQEVMAMSPSPLATYMFWVREEADANAEVDLVLPYKAGILPVEVKAGASGRLRSLFEFIDRTENQLAVRVLDNQFSVETCNTLKGKAFTLVNLPLYAVGKLWEIVEQLSSKSKD